MCKKARSIYTFHVADWYVVKRIKHIKMGAEVVIRLKELQVVVLVVKGIWFEVCACVVVVSRFEVAGERVEYSNDTVATVASKFFRWGLVVSRLDGARETVENHSNDTVASKSFR